MSKIPLKSLDLSTSRYGLQIYHRLHGLSSSLYFIIMNETKKSRKKLGKLSIIGMESSTNPNAELSILQRKNQVAIAQTDEEYWASAWLRAESHWEGRENDRYIDNYKRKFAEQEFNSLKKRCKTQIGENCTCIVAIKYEDKRMELKSIIGTLDLSIRYLSQGETFPGERKKTPIFCLIDRKSSNVYGYIANLCVAKLARRQGVASNMLRFAINYAKEIGDAEKVFVHVHRHNEPAQIMYQKLGFEVVDEATSQLCSDETYLLRLKL